MQKKTLEPIQLVYLNVQVILPPFLIFLLEPIQLVYLNMMLHLPCPPLFELEPIQLVYLNKYVEENPDRLEA